MRSVLLLLLLGCAHEDPEVKERSACEEYLARISRCAPDEAAVHAMRDAWSQRARTEPARVTAQCERALAHTPACP